jgi:hypothetical protein
MKPFIIAWACHIAVMVLIGLVLMPSSDFSRLDFHCFYAAGFLARTHPAQIYDVAQQMRAQLGPAKAAGWAPFIQPPYEALLFVPFSFAPYRVAYLLFLLFNLVLILPCFLLARSAFSCVLEPWQPRPGLMFFLFLPLSVAALDGQGSIRVLLICCAAWHEMKRDQDFNVGLLLALALFKLQIAIPLALLLILRRGVRMLGGFTLGAILLAAVSAWLVGIGGMQAFAKTLVLNSLIKDQSAAAQMAMTHYPSGMPNLRGLVYSSGGRYLPHSWLLAITLAISIAVALWVIHLMRRQHDEGTAFAVAILGTLLLSYHLNFYDLTPLLLPLALLTGQRGKHFHIIAASCFVFPVLLVSFALQAGFVMSIPLLGLLLLIAREDILDDQSQLTQAAATR